MRNIKQIFFVCSFLAGFPALAVLPFADTGNLLPQRQTDISAHVVIPRMEGRTGLSFLLSLDSAHSFKRALNMRYFTGFGLGGFRIGSLMKWVPFPDYKKQPALGSAFGLEYQWVGRANHLLNIHARPFLSKKISTAVGAFTPYVALPLALQIKNLKQVHIPIRWALGLKSEVLFIFFEHLYFYTEIGRGFDKYSSFYFNLGFSTRWSMSVAAPQIDSSLQSFKVSDRGAAR